MWKSLTLFLLFSYSPIALNNTVNINVYGSVVASPCELETKNHLIDLKKSILEILKMVKHQTG